MTPRFLYPFRKRVEMFGALYAGGFGMFIWLSLAVNGHSPINWIEVGGVRHIWIGEALALAAFVHALGIRINGQWRYSPALRLVGMTIHLGIFAGLALSGWGSSAFYTYAWISAALLTGVWSSARDLYRALGWDAEWKAN